MKSKKEVIYIDIEDDITSVIEKANAAKSDIVALVLPKRFAVLQSSVNMKLLKKATKDQGKKVVLITTETGLLPLAGAAGIHVAESLKSRPAVPKVEEEPKQPVYEEEPVLSPDTEVGELEKGKSDDTKKDAAAEGDPADSGKKKKLAGMKWPGKLKIPSFSKFRNKVILAAVGALIFIVGWIFAFIVLPSANVTILAQTSQVPVSTEFSASLNTDENNSESGVLAAEAKELKRNVSRNFVPSGEKDIGEKATGTMTVQNCEQSSTLTVPSGTVFTDETSGFSFTSDSEVLVPAATFTDGGDTCTAGEADVAVTAVEAGDEKNLSPRGYFVEGFSNDVTGFGGQMSGGTSEIVKIVTKQDVNQAAQELENSDDDEALQELIGQFDEGMYILGETFNKQAGNPKSEPKVGQQAEEATVTAEFTYSVIAVSEEALVNYLEQEETKLIENGEQSVLDNGLSAAVITLENRENGVYQMSLSTEAYIGPEIDTNALAEEISGKKFSEVTNIIESKAGVQEVEVDFSPFWVFNAPRASKITINVQINES